MWMDTSSQLTVQGQIEFFGGLEYTFWLVVKPASAQTRKGALSNYFIKKYVENNWDTVKSCAGGYKIEHKGAQLFEKIEGDFFCILGMPLLEVMSFLKLRGVLES